MAADAAGQGVGGPAARRSRCGTPAGVRGSAASPAPGHGASTSCGWKCGLQRAMNAGAACRGQRRHGMDGGYAAWVPRLPPPRTWEPARRAGGRPKRRAAACPRCTGFTCRARRQAARARALFSSVSLASAMPNADRPRSPALPPFAPSLGSQWRKKRMRRCVPRAALLCFAPSVKPFQHAHAARMHSHGMRRAPAAPPPIVFRQRGQGAASSACASSCCMEARSTHRRPVAAAQ